MLPSAGLQTFARWAGKGANGLQLLGRGHANPPLLACICRYSYSTSACKVALLWCTRAALPPGYYTPVSCTFRPAGSGFRARATGSHRVSRGQGRGNTTRNPSWSGNAGSVGSLQPVCCVLWQRDTDRLCEGFLENTALLGRASDLC